MELVEEKPLLAPRWLDYGKNGERFRLKCLNGCDKADVEDRIHSITVDGETAIHFTAAGKVICVSAGLIDWDGIVDSEGKSIKFNISLIHMLPKTVLNDLAYEIYLGSILSEPTKKKSSSKPTSSSTRKSTTAKRAKKSTATKKKKRRSKSST